MYIRMTADSEVFDLHVGTDGKILLLAASSGESFVLGLFHHILHRQSFPLAYMYTSIDRVHGSYFILSSHRAVHIYHIEEGPALITAVDLPHGSKLVLAHDDQLFVCDKHLLYIYA